MLFSFTLRYPKKIMFIYHMLLSKGVSIKKSIPVFGNTILFILCFAYYYI